MARNPKPSDAMLLDLNNKRLLQFLEPGTCDSRTTAHKTRRGGDKSFFVVLLGRPKPPKLWIQSDPRKNNLALDFDDDESSTTSICAWNPLLNRSPGTRVTALSKELRSPGHGKKKPRCCWTPRRHCTKLFNNALSPSLHRVTPPPLPTPVPYTRPKNHHEFTTTCNNDYEISWKKPTTKRSQHAYMQEPSRARGELCKARLLARSHKRNRAQTRSSIHN
jgi:hypothetical protein